MDPITSTIVSGVLWFFAGSVGAVLIYLITAFGIAGGIGALLSPGDRAEGYARGVAVGVFPSWILSIAWEVFVVIQVAIHIVTLIQLLT